MPTLALALNESILSSDILDRIKSLSPNYDLLISRDSDELKSKLADIEIAVGNFPQALLKDAPKLRWFQQWGAGADWLQKQPELQSKELIITNASGVHPVQITEHVFAMLLAFARQLPKSYAAQQEHKWLELNHKDVFELEGKTMLVVGVGAIGERIAQIASAFGMRVMGMKRHPKPINGIEKMFGPEDLHAVLGEADVVVLTLPLTSETKNFIGKRELELMKDDACLINIGRGGTIDEDALAQALSSGKFLGIGLDVFEEEPLAQRSPLWQFERVMVTAHYSGLSPRYDKRAFEIFFENLKRYHAKEKLMNVVDKALGY